MGNDGGVGLPRSLDGGRLLILAGVNPGVIRYSCGVFIRSGSRGVWT
jgi:hypothetical protein